jgi:transaldolase/glucose-6-phosphate isomerase
MASIREVTSLGQSVWLDSIHRGFIRDGSLRRLVGEGLRGVTANPSIFRKAIVETTDYAGAIRQRAATARSAAALYEALAIADVQDAADVLRPVYDETAGRDGFVSLEVAPRLAHDTRGTIEEARRLWRAVGRENVMIKVPGTPEGVLAVEVLTDEGVNVNVTLLFSLRAYQAAAGAFLVGLEKRAARGADVGRIASVASFFVSRIDTAVDRILAARLGAAGPAERPVLESLAGKAAVACAKRAYHLYGRIFDGPAWRKLADRGARTQRLLWASTGTKNPAYSDVKYVEELVGPDTVDTMPLATLEAFRDHGRATATLAPGLDEAEATVAALERAGIPIAEVTAGLLADGILQFDEAMNGLLAAMEKARRASARAGRGRGPVAAR